MSEQETPPPPTPQPDGDAHEELRRKVKEANKDSATNVELRGGR